MELDAAYFQEIAILGMIHLTTHRFTFHASLLSTRPDLMPEKQVIKTGAVTLHRKGLRRKMRLWAELSHDMITIVFVISPFSLMLHELTGSLVSIQ